MDVVNADNTLEFKTIGGVMNLKLFIGETAEEAVRYYHEYVGGYILHPFWASGFH